MMGCECCFFFPHSFCLFLLPPLSTSRPPKTKLLILSSSTRWKLSSYNHKFYDDIRLWRVTLTLAQLPNQPAMSDIIRIPRPSQLDDWHLYEHMEEAAMRALFGDRGAFKWKENREEEKRARESWRRAHEFGQSISLPSGMAMGLGVGVGMGAAPLGGGGGSAPLLMPNLQAVEDKDERVKKAMMDLVRIQEIYVPGSVDRDIVPGV